MNSGNGVRSQSDFRELFSTPSDILFANLMKYLDAVGKHTILQTPERSSDPWF